MHKKYSELGYISGLFDSKGSMKIEKDSLLVWITVEDFKVVEFLQRFGAVVAKRSDGKFKAKWKDKRAGELLEAMLPYLIVKRDQADLGVEFAEFKANKADPKTYVLPLQVRLRLLKKDEPEE